ncbi:MAG: CBS domain-containing protein [Candidatus Nanoarchaeia archaeon]|nr:CBS domain-containing protein [Candidatus Nanoarchaeia archaeon]
MKTGVKVMDAMTREPITVRPEMNIVQAAARMMETGVGGAIVVDKNIPLGIITEKDIVSKIVAENKNPVEIRVKDIMSSKLTTVHPEEDIYDALMVMGDNDIKRLPVVHDGNIVGLLTFKDVIRIQPQLFDVIAEKFRVRDESNKMALSQGIVLKGYCESCNAYESLLNSDGSYVCEDCLRSS